MIKMNDGLWACEIAYCGYCYNPKLGDPTQNILPGTSFEELPDDWCCPKCKIGKERFSPYPKN